MPIATRNSERGRPDPGPNGETVELGPGEVLFARPGVKREATAVETPTLLFMVGGRPGEPYSPPIWAFDWSEPAG